MFKLPKLQQKDILKNYCAAVGLLMVLLLSFCSAEVVQEGETSQPFEILN